LSLSAIPQPEDECSIAAQIVRETTKIRRDDTDNPIEFALRDIRSRLPTLVQRRTGKRTNNKKIA
jgi:hypothetical protein